MHYIDQYFRDIYTLLHSRRLKGKWFMFFFYQYLCAKNIIGKAFNIKFSSQKFKHFTIQFDNFNAFFAIFTEIFIYNIYFFESDKKAPRIVDCGANIGMAVLYFKYHYPEAKIDCFEPDKGTFTILQKNILSNHLSDVTAHNTAVSGEIGELEFYSFGGMEGGPGNSLEKSQANFTNINTYKVPVTTLSSQKYTHIDFLKIDIEGSEGKLFHDIEKHSLLKNIDRISLEYHYDTKIAENSLSDILKILEESNMHTIINMNSLVTLCVDAQEFKSWNDSYVLLIDAYHKT